MRLNVKRAIAAVAAGTIALTTVGLTTAEARGNRHHHGFYHRHHNGAGQAFLGAMGAMALIVGASQYGYYEPYYAYPYGSGYPYWNGSYWVYGPGYGGPVYGPPGVYWR